MGNKWNKNKPYLKIKKSLDITLSIIGLIVLSPILLLTAIIIKLESRGPVLFKQDRLGLDGKIFKIYKFRSMYEGAETRGSGQYSFKGDPRVTKVGKFIRATSIDELPQFFNILKGEMSIIGPRPTLTYHPWSFEKYTEEQLKRFDVLPGVTGWAQMHGRKEPRWEDRMALDAYYVDNLCFKLDFKILCMTVHHVFLIKNNVNVEITVDDKHTEDVQSAVAATKE